ncbi:MAG: LptF/LptG family permease [Thermoguttaceae bacterium]
MRILTRYVLSELLKVFLISLTGLTTLFVVVVVIREAQQEDLPLAQVLQLIPYALPEALRMTVPVTLLLACTSVFARMSGANEVVAAKALGISPMVLVWPALALAASLSLVTVWLNDLAVSWGRNGMQQIVVGSIDEIIYSVLRSQHRYNTPYFAINVKGVEGRRLLRPIVSVQSRGTSGARTLTAEWAELQADAVENTLRITLHKGTIDAGKLTGELFDDPYRMEIPLTDASRANNLASRPPSWLPMRLIPGEVAKQQAAIERCDQQMAAQAAYQMLCGDFDRLTGPAWDSSLDQRRGEQSLLYRLLTEPPRRWSAGFSCLCFAWVGVPIAIRFRNRDFLTSFFLCFLPILIVYYPLLMLCIHLAKEGLLPPCSVWVCNILLAAWGIWVLRRVVRY